MSRQVRNIHFYLPAVCSLLFFFPLFFLIVDADDAIQQATLCLHASYQIHPRVCREKDDTNPRWLVVIRSGQERRANKKLTSSLLC